MRVRLDLDERTYEALAAAAVANLRPINWQALVILETALGTRSANPSPDVTNAVPDRTAIESDQRQLAAA